MKGLRTISDQVSRVWILLLWIYLPSLGMLVLIVVASSWTGDPISFFTRDPAAITGTNFYAGVLSNIGALLWSATATICFFCVVILNRLGEPGRWVLFFSVWGAITLMLLFDDFFMLHERFFLTHLKLPQTVVMIAYGISIFIALVFFWKQILETEYLPLLFSFVFFASSLIIDSVPENVLASFHHIFEDGFKFVGITSWLAYFSRTAVKAIQDAFKKLNFSEKFSF